MFSNFHNRFFLSSFLFCNRQTRYAANATASLSKKNHTKVLKNKETM
ncbi:hypothetical protein HMPREF0653_02520 [Prevotella disiens JCM 6334 = ATCC 29426]|uniref:Uncharacterized protein n=1 Tax=Prevotella disiens JCM 6334 = ATCC 29426 TaxID=1235811 RepID=A0ABN0NP16_9BACT|nr:hypothetical protein HMPREF0653_02520 [Prevotella disiens JCM 6334 = ATCC 29426]